MKNTISNYGSNYYFVKIRFDYCYGGQSYIFTANSAENAKHKIRVYAQRWDFTNMSILECRLATIEDMQEDVFRIQQKNNDYTLDNYMTECATNWLAGVI